MGLPGVLWLGSGLASLIFPAPLLPQDAPIRFWAETLQLRLVVVPSPAGEGLLPPGIKVGVQLRKGGSVTPGPE